MEPYFSESFVAIPRFDRHRLFIVRLRDHRNVFLDLIPSELSIVLGALGLENSQDADLTHYQSSIRRVICWTSPNQLKCYISFHMQHPLSLAPVKVIELNANEVEGFKAYIRNLIEQQILARLS